MDSSHLAAVKTPETRHDHGISSVHFSRSVMSDSLWSHGLQHARLLCPSPAPKACSNSCPSSWWCHPTVSSSVVPLSSHLQSFPASGSFPVSQFFAWGSQSIGASASPSVLPVNIQDWFPLGLTGLIPYCPKDSQESSPTAQFDNSYHPTQPHLCNHLCIICSNFLTGFTNNDYVCFCHSY